MRNEVVAKSERRLYTAGCPTTSYELRGRDPGASRANGRTEHAMAATVTLLPNAPHAARANRCKNSEPGVPRPLRWAPWGMPAWALEAAPLGRPHGGHGIVMMEAAGIRPHFHSPGADI